MTWLRHLRERRQRRAAHRALRHVNAALAERGLMRVLERLFSLALFALVGLHVVGFTTGSNLDRACGLVLLVLLVVDSQFYGWKLARRQFAAIVPKLSQDGHGNAVLEFGPWEIGLTATLEGMPREREPEQLH